MSVLIARRMFKKAVQSGRSKRGRRRVRFRYVEPLSAARTKLAGFFNILERGVTMGR